MVVKAFPHVLHLWYGKEVDCSGWRRWIVIIVGGACERWVFPICKSGYMQKVFVKMYLYLSNFKIVFQIDKLIGMYWYGEGIFSICRSGSLGSEKWKFFIKLKTEEGILIDRWRRVLPICMSESMGRGRWIDFEGGIIIKGFDLGADCIANENTDSGN